MFFCTLKKATRPDQIQAFIDGNPQIDVPRSYLENSDVYLLYHYQQIVGGFVYGLGPVFRYVERMDDPKLQSRYREIFSQHSVAELTILWLRKDYRKTIFSFILWAQVALKSFFGPADYIIFGTSVPILTRALDYPRSTTKLVTFELKQEYRDKYKLGALSLFAVERARSLMGMAEGVYFLLFRPGRGLAKKKEAGLLVSNVKYRSMVVKLPNSRLRRQAAWAIIGLVFVFVCLLARDFAYQKIDFSVGMKPYILEFFIVLGCILGVYVAVLLLASGTLSIDSKNKTLHHSFSSLWVWERKYELNKLRSVEIRSIDDKDRKEYYLQIKGPEEGLSFTFWDLKVATQVGKEIAEAGGLRNKGYDGVQR